MTQNILWSMTPQNIIGHGYDELLGGLVYQMTWEKFKMIAKNHGFKIGGLRNFIGHGWNYDGERIQEEIIFYKEENSFILYASSFNHTSINQAILYGEMK